MQEIYITTGNHHFCSGDNGKTFGQDICAGHFHATHSLSSDFIEGNTQDLNEYPLKNALGNYFGSEEVRSVVAQVKRRFPNSENAYIYIDGILVQPKILNDIVEIQSQQVEIQSQQPEILKELQPQQPEILKELQPQQPEILKENDTIVIAIGVILFMLLTLK